MVARTHFGRAALRVAQKFRQVRRIADTPR
jgi:hypothetical protein